MTLRAQTTYVSNYNLLGRYFILIAGSLVIDILVGGVIRPSGIIWVKHLT